ncbi:FAD-dependent oxidoreductase [Roseovarius salis]|uniref:NAD(P)/FAD-dependent oxidoreductase n=1 Tax=Roseovarius salis TaxID=3376063 RepID=UPI0037CC66D4
MPFESAAPMRKQIAVIGAGVSGMGAAYALAPTHDVTLFESEPRLGGHARTVMAGKRGDQPVDTGFIVFNYANYPNLSRIFDELDVAVTQSDMSFGASVRGGRVEYGLRGAGAFFAQKRNAANPFMWAMLRDIFRFNARAVEMSSAHPDLTIGAFLDALGMGRWFRDYYLLPLTGAIWSTPTRQVEAFPAQAMVRFLHNHGLLSYDGQHQWYTVAGGSTAYVERLGRALRAHGAQVRLGCPVQAVRRTGQGVSVRVPGADWQHFDEVIFATHSDVTLSLLADPSEAERRALGAVRYQPNDVVLHADTSVMPRRRAVWSSWNYSESPAKRDGQIDITYWMNSLQPIPRDDPHFVTLNSNRPIREELIYDQVTLSHPVYDLAALEAQRTVREMNGARGTWFCGAWLRDGFHEDGLSTGLEAAEAILARDTVALAAE